MPKQQKEVFSKKGAQAPIQEIRNAVRCRIREHEQASKRAKEEQVGRDMYRFRFFRHRFLWWWDGVVMAWVFLVYKMPESARALCRMVSLTAAKTRRMLDVSVACVRLEGVSFCCDVSLGKCLGFEIHTYWGYKFRCARLTWLKRHSRYLAARLTSLPPE